MVHREKIYNCNNCKANFKYKDLQVKSSDYGGIKIRTKVCPYCRSESWSDDEERERLKRFLRLNLSEFYSYLV